MITGDMIYNLPFYNAGGIFTGGSIHGSRYRIEKTTVSELPQTVQETDADSDSDMQADDGTVFLVTVWTGGNCYDKTPEDLMTRKTFPFDADGREAMLAWLNEGKWGL